MQKLINEKKMKVLLELKNIDQTCWRSSIIPPMARTEKYFNIPRGNEKESDDIRQALINKMKQQEQITNNTSQNFQQPQHQQQQPQFQQQQQ